MFPSVFFSFLMLSVLRQDLDELMQTDDIANLSPDHKSSLFHHQSLWSNKRTGSKSILIIVAR